MFVNFSAQSSLSNSRVGSKSRSFSTSSQLLKACAVFGGKKVTQEFKGYIPSSHIHFALLHCCLFQFQRSPPPQTLSSSTLLLLPYHQADQFQVLYRSGDQGLRPNQRHTHTKHCTLNSKSIGCISPSLQLGHCTSLQIHNHHVP